MDIISLREIYKRILCNIASAEDEKVFLKSFLNSGGMSTEWFYFCLTGKIEDPTVEELDSFIDIIKDLAKKY